MRSLLSLGLVAMSLSATGNAGSISFETPFVSGDVSTFVNRRETSRMDLSSKQLQGLDDWLEGHRSGWDGMVTEATSEPVQLHLNLKQRDGGVTSISIITRANGGRYLRVTGPGKWAYESFHGLLKFWAATQTLSEQDWAALEKLVSST